MILIGILGGLLAGLALGGRWSALLHVRLRYAALIVIAIVLRYGTQLLLAREVAIVDALRVPLLAAAFGVLIGALWLNRASPGLILVLVGSAANALAILVNGGHMPAWLPALAAAGLPATDLSPTWHVVLPDAIDATFLAMAGPLGDIVPIPLPVLTNVISIGDLAIALGVGWFLFATLRWGDDTGPEGGVAIWSGPAPSAPIQPRPVILGTGQGPGLLPPAPSAPSSVPRTLAQRARAHPYVRLAGDGRFSAFWLGQTISVFGDRLNQVAMGVLVLGLTGSLVLSALVFVCAMLPNLLLGPIAGTFVDRWDQRRVMIAADLLRAGLVLLLPLAASVELWLVYPVVFLTTTVSLFFRPARSAVLPRIVREDDLLAANSAMWTGETLADIGGYPLAGALVALLGPGIALAFWLDAATYVTSAVAIAAIAVPPVVRSVAPRTGTALRAIAVELRDGWRFLRDSPPLFGNTLVSTLGQLSLGATLALTPAYVYLLIGSPPPIDGDIPGLAPTLGALEAVLGLGNLVGGILVGLAGARLGKGPMVIGGFLLMGIATIVLGLAGEVTLALVASFAVGFFNLVWLIPSQTLFGELVPAELMGRVIAIRSSIVFGAMTGSAALCTLAAGIVAPGMIFAALGAVTVLAGLLGALLPAVRDVPEPRTA